MNRLILNSETALTLNVISGNDKVLVYFKVCNLVQLVR